jgi:large subunit ribosomal protein L33
LTCGAPSLSCAPNPTLIQRLEPIMAKSSTLLIKLVSSADTGYYYVTKKNPRKTTDKLEFKKYDPVARKHVVFREGKIK